MDKSEKSEKKQMSYEEVVIKLENKLKDYTYTDSALDQTKSIKDYTIRIAETIAKNDQTDIETVLLAISMILQSGGYLKGVNNRKVCLQDYELHKKKIISSMKSNRCPYTLRTIARVNRDFIAKVARKTRTVGNLYSQYKIYNPEILKENEETQFEHAIYCTDFQRENPVIPTKVLNFLSTREISRKNK